MDRFLPAFRAEFETFLEVVAGDRPSPCTVADGLEADWIAEACARSMRHRPVRIEEGAHPRDRNGDRPGRRSGKCAAADPSEPLRLGVLGAARIAELAIVKPAQGDRDRLVAIAARGQARASAFAAEHGVEQALGSYADVVASPDVEAVYNPLPNALRGTWNLAAIGAGKHVLSEKPFAANAEEAAEVAAAAQEAAVCSSSRASTTATTR